MTSAEQLTASWVKSLPEEQRQRLVMSVTPRLTRYIPTNPTPKQTVALLVQAEEMLFGGAAGGGKSQFLLTAALQYVDVPNYAAMLLRRTYADLALPGALMDRANEWLRGSGARWQDRDKTWTFPSGATLTFGYLEGPHDHLRYQGAELHFCGFDELTQLKDVRQYTYMFSRLRRQEGSKVPIRMRAASNPGGPGNSWVKERFVDPGDPSRPFVRSLISDNPFIDQEAYVRSLEHLDPVSRAQLMRGDWTARAAGEYFRRRWFEIVERAPIEGRAVSFIDLAASIPSDDYPDPSWTCRVRMRRSPAGIYYVERVNRDRLRPAPRDEWIENLIRADGIRCPVWIEQEPASGGKSQVDYLRRRLTGFEVRGERKVGKTEDAVGPFASEAEAGNVKMVAGPWVEAFLEELEAFPVGHTDQVVAAIGAHRKLAVGGGVTPDDLYGPDGYLVPKAQEPAADEEAS